MPSKKLAAKGSTTSVVPPDSQAMSGRLLGETCACATSGQATALPSRMKSRRLMERSLAGGRARRHPMQSLVIAPWQMALQQCRGRQLQAIFFGAAHVSRGSKTDFLGMSAIGAELPFQTS